MPFQRMVVQLLVAGLLLLFGWLINEAMLWSAISNIALPWLCTAIGLSLLIQTATAAARGESPEHIPKRVAIGVIVTVMVFFGVGLILDAWAYGAFSDNSPLGSGALVSVGEWIGFAILLAGAFFLPRAGRKPGD